MNSQENASTVRIGIIDDRVALRCRLIIQLIKNTGATPVLIPRTLPQPGKPCKYLEDKHKEEVSEIINTCHGIIFPGNKQDVPPSAYTNRSIHPQTLKRLPKNLCDFRFQTESHIIKILTELRPLPLLTICGGTQTINVVLGGKLVQHLPDAHRVRINQISHREPKLKKLKTTQIQQFEQQFTEYLINRNIPNIFPKSHPVEIDRQSILNTIYQIPDDEPPFIHELSLHHQGCFEQQLSKQLRPIAISPDGVIEAMVMDQYPKFNLLTQYHWECDVENAASTIMKTFVDQAKKEVVVDH